MEIDFFSKKFDLLNINIKALRYIIKNKNLDGKKEKNK